MDTRTQVQIYLADKRGCSQTDVLCSYHSFNFGAYQDESRTPFGALHLLNDDRLHAGARLTLPVEQNTDVLLIPLVGGLEFSTDAAANFVEPGQAQTLSLAAGMTYTVSNPYETEAIQFLQIWLTNSSPDFVTAVHQTDFNLRGRNTLLEVARTTSGGQVYIGQYEGRAEGTYALPQPAGKTSAKGVFVFILQGVFEVQNRLLHERDGLALLYDGGSVLEFEALSNEALLLLIDLVSLR